MSIKGIFLIPTVFKRCNSFSNNGESNPALDDWCEEDEELDEDGEEEGESQKVKKTVRFSNVVHKQLFRYTQPPLS